MPFLVDLLILQSKAELGADDLILERLSPSKMHPKILVKISLVFLAIASLCSQAQAGYISSTSFQDGTKEAFGQDGSASRIGTFDFGPAATGYILARVRLWVQLPLNATGTSAPLIYFVKKGESSFNAALVNGNTVRTDIRISADGYQSGLGVLEKQTGFESLTQAQGAGIASLIRSDADHQVEVWLVSDKFNAITVPRFIQLISITPEGDIITTQQRLTSTIDMVIPEPSSILAFCLIPLIAYPSSKRRKTSIHFTSRRLTSRRSSPKC